MLLERFAVLVCLPACLSRAGEFTRDRPDFTESADVVDRGATQIESGFVFATTGADGRRRAVVTFPSSLLRVELGRRPQSSAVFDSGVTRKIGRNVQIDIEAGRAVVRSETDWFIGWIRDPAQRRRRSKERNVV